MAPSIPDDPPDTDIDEHLQAQLNGLAAQQRRLEASMRVNVDFDLEISQEQRHLARASAALGAEIRQRDKYIGQLAERLTNAEKLAAVKPFLEDLSDDDLRDVGEFLRALIDRRGVRKQIDLRVTT